MLHCANSLKRKYVFYTHSTFQLDSAFQGSVVQQVACVLGSTEVVGPRPWMRCSGYSGVSLAEHNVWL